MMSDLVPSSLSPMTLAHDVRSTPSPPSTPMAPRRREADTIQKTWFFHALDSRGSKTKGQVYKEEGLSKSTA